MGDSSVPAKLSGQVVINELLRNMELGSFEMAYSVLLPCVFDVYLNAADHARLNGVFDLIGDDARRALAARVAKLNGTSARIPVLRRRPTKIYKIAAKDWVVRFLVDPEGSVPLGDVEIHSELSESVSPGFQGTKTTLMEREPSVTAVQTPGIRGETRRLDEPVFAEIRYEDDSGPQVYLVNENHIRIGRGAADEPVELALYTNDEVSRDHAHLRRDSGTGQFYLLDRSTNGTWVDGSRLRRDVELPLPERAEIRVGDALTLLFQVRR